ncbi:MAG TPA: hypothetical protein VLS96_03705 [Nodosilinea sp.]|nr:hypothetical protein [Nodosilinea sp.]
MVGLLVAKGMSFGVAGSGALLAGAPAALAGLGAITPPEQGAVIALFIAALYGLLARGIWRGSTMALGLSLLLLLGDLGWGLLVGLGVSGEVPPGLVVLLAAVFFGPRLGLIYLLSQCLSRQRDNPTALKIGALAQGLAEVLVDPIGWLFYRAGRSTLSSRGQAAPPEGADPGAQQTPSRPHRQ